MYEILGVSGVDNNVDVDEIDEEDNKDLINILKISLLKYLLFYKHSLLNFCNFAHV